VGGTKLSLQLVPIALTEVCLEVVEMHTINQVPARFAYVAFLIKRSVRSRLVKAMDKG
jgi:hypothetical protein